MRRCQHNVPWPLVISSKLCLWRVGNTTLQMTIYQSCIYSVLISHPSNWKYYWRRALITTLHCVSLDDVLSSVCLSVCLSLWWDWWLSLTHDTVTRVTDDTTHWKHNSSCYRTCLHTSLSLSLQHSCIAVPRRFNEHWSHGAWPCISH